MFAAASSILNWGTGGAGRGNAGDDNSNNNSNNGRPSRAMFSNDNDNDDDDDDDDDDDLYLPSYADVFVVKAMLGHAGNLPLELVDAIIDHAEYWPHTHAEADSTRLITVPSRSFSTSANNLFLCRTPPLGFTEAPAAEDDDNGAAEYSTRGLEPRPLPNPDPAHPGHDATCLPDTIQGWLPAQQSTPVERPCRKIVFTIVSRDQGWANNLQDKGTYKGSYSWFDVGLERYGRTPAPPQEERGDDSSHSSMPPDVKLYSVIPAVVETDASPAEPQPNPYTHYFPLLPGADRLQSNRVAVRQWTKHKVVWSWTDGGGPTGADVAADHVVATDEGTQGAEDAPGPEATEEHPLDKIGRGSATGDGEFVRSLCVGDVVTVWAKARFPGWVNSVQSMQVDVFWAV